jgi:hypothetical protein
MDSVGTFIFCWNMLEHFNEIFSKSHFPVGTRKVFCKLLEHFCIILSL